MIIRMLYLLPVKKKNVIFTENRKELKLTEQAKSPQLLK